MPVDIDNVEFDPTIHAVRADGKPKKTPRGTWANLPTDKPAVAETPEKPALLAPAPLPVVDVAPVAPIQPEKPQAGKRVLAIYANGYRATMDKLDAIEMMQRGAVTNYLEDF